MRVLTWSLAEVHAFYIAETDPLLVAFSAKSLYTTFSESYATCK